MVLGGTGAYNFKNSMKDVWLFDAKTDSISQSTTSFTNFMMQPSIELVGHGNRCGQVKPDTAFAVVTDF